MTTETEIQRLTLHSGRVNTAIMQIRSLGRSERNMLNKKSKRLVLRIVENMVNLITTSDPYLNGIMSSLLNTATAISNFDDMEMAMIQMEILVTDLGFIDGYIDGYISCLRTRQK
jgi:DNA modification methylase